MEVTWGHQQFFANNLRTLNKIETWDLAVIAFVSTRRISGASTRHKAFVSTRRMMYNLTYLGHRVTLPTWPEVKFWPWPYNDQIIHGSTRLDETNTMVSKSLLYSLKLKMLSSKNRFGKFWNFDPWWPQFWPEPKNDRNDFEMIFRELSNAVFRFVLRCAGAEIDGGGVQTPPPPSRWWKIQRPSRARVNLRPGGGHFGPPWVFLPITRKRIGAT